MKSLFTELRRRNVFRVGIAYLTAAWLILQVADTVLNNTAAPPWVMQVVMLVLAVGLAFAVFFAWAFEVTPEGIKREAEVDRGQSVTRAAGRKLNRAIIVLLVIALGYFVWEARFAERPMPADPPADAPGEADTSNRKSIAVLAFTDLSAEGDQEYFAHGVSEEILNDLAQIPGLRVTSRSSSFSFAGKDVDIPTVAAQLAVANVLEGSVRKAGSRIRITAQLIDARQDVHLWSATYDRELADIFAVQDEISAAIVLALQKHLGLAHGVVPRPVTAANAAAHEAYLRGRHLVVQNTDSATEAAMREFENAIELDPEYAIAYAELAIAATLQDLEAGGVPQAEVVAAAEPHVRRALSLNPNLAEAHAAAGLLEWRQSRPEHALTHLRRAVDINPNYVDVYVWMGNLLNFELGRYDEAFRMRSKAMRLDPLSIRTIVFYLQALIERHRFDEANRELEKIAAIYPHIYAYRRGTLLSQRGNLANAILGSLDALRINPGYSRPKVGLGYHLAAVGLVREVLGLAEYLEPGALSNIGYHEEAVMLAESRLAQSPDSLAQRHDLGLALAAAGDYRRARPILEDMWRYSGGVIAKRADLFHTGTAVALIAIRRDAGEEGGIGELVAAIRDNVRRYREAGIVGDGRSFGADYEAGLASYLSGNREVGLGLLEKATDDGVFIPEQTAYLRTLVDDPGFTPILERQRARQARERAKILSVVCTDNPYASVWRPAPGTCDRFRSADGA